LEFFDIDLLPVGKRSACFCTSVFAYDGSEPDPGFCKDSFEWDAGKAAQTQVVLRELLG
jgi:hypothetical protein